MRRAELGSITQSPKNGPKVYGGGLTPYGIFLLADSYREAGQILSNSTRSGRSDNPIRLLYYQALEHYLRMFLRAGGKEPSEIREYQHDFEKMFKDCVANGLVIRQKTAKFLQETTNDSDYVRVRYERELTVPNGRFGRGQPRKNLTRLISATDELREKARAVLIKSGIQIP
jgi:hypothetical protein